MAQYGRRLVYAAVGSTLLLAVLFLLQTGPVPLHTTTTTTNNHFLRRHRRSLQGQDDPAGVQRRARKEVDMVASEVQRTEKQLSGIMPGGRHAPPA